MEGMNESASSPSTARAIGWLTVVSALAGTGLAVAIIMWPEQVPDTRWSFPFAAAPYVAFQVSFCLHHLTLIPGLALVARWAWPHATRTTRIGFGLTVASTALGAAIELAAVSAARVSATSALANTLGAAYGVMCLGLGVGFVLAGLALRNRPLVDGLLGRWTYLAIGVWTFFPLLPSLFMPMVWGRITIGTWYLMYVGIGVTILRTSQRRATASDPALTLSS